jgi:hypothetical protein
MWMVTRESAFAIVSLCGGLRQMAAWLALVADARPLDGSVNGRISSEFDASQRHAAADNARMAAAISRRSSLS